MKNIIKMRWKMSKSILHNRIGLSLNFGLVELTKAFVIYNKAHRLIRYHNLQLNRIRTQPINKMTNLIIFGGT